MAANSALTKKVKDQQDQAQVSMGYAPQGAAINTSQNGVFVPPTNLQYDFSNDKVSASHVDENGNPQANAYSYPSQWFNPKGNMQPWVENLGRAQDQVGSNDDTYLFNQKAWQDTVGKGGASWTPDERLATGQKIMDDPEYFKQYLKEKMLGKGLK